MCTVTWRALEDGRGYEVVANRDEQRTRLPAEPPAIRRVGATRVVAPVDGDAGGTWVGVNEHGVALCLLNGRLRRGEEPPTGFRSRGLLVGDLLPCPSIDEVLETVRAHDLDVYRGFRLLVFAPGLGPQVLAWSGRHPTIGPAGDPPQISSPKDPAAARAARVPAYERMVREPGVSTERLLAYHRSHRPERGPVSVCMHRDDAHTVSASHVRVDADEIAFAYAPGPPCRTPYGEPVRLARVRRG